VTKCDTEVSNKSQQQRQNKCMKRNEVRTCYYVSVSSVSTPPQTSGVDSPLLSCKRSLTPTFLVYKQ